MKRSDIDYKSFRIKKTLCPKIWDEDDKMYPEVRKKLLLVAKKFWNTVTSKVKVIDVIVTGSIANYNWSEYSDIDLHLIVDFSKINDDVELVDRYLTSKKEEWNRTHDIKIHGFDVEVFVQNIDVNDLVSGGIYTVVGDYWIKHPSMPDINFNMGKVRRYVGAIMKRFRDLQERYMKGDYDGLYDDLSKLRDDIQKMRDYGLKNGGEFSAENLAFKALRRNGAMDAMKEMKGDINDKDMSIDDEKPQRLGKTRDKKEKPRDPIEQAAGRYLIAGKRYVSLRQAEKKLGIPKSTIEYRLKSDNPKYNNYRILPV